jgi:hypothetical protein
MTHICNMTLQNTHNLSLFTYDNKDQKTEYRGWSDCHSSFVWEEANPVNEWQLTTLVQTVRGLPYSLPQGKYWNSTYKWTKATFFFIASNSLLTIILKFEALYSWGNVVKRTKINQGKLIF